MNRSLIQAVISSNRRRQKQIEYNLSNYQLPAMARKSGSGQKELINNKNEGTVDLTARPIYEEHYATPMAAESLAEYNTEHSLEELIAKAKADMESAAKALDFMAAAQHRDRMYQLQQQLEESKKR